MHAHQNSKVQGAQVNIWFVLYVSVLLSHADGCPEDYEKYGKLPGEALSAFLEEIRQYSIRNRGKKRLLMVLDGLDEISEDGLWDFIPKEEMISRGVYFLLTSRDPQSEELPENVCDHLEALSVTEEKCVSRQNSNNVEFLKEYINKTKIKLQI